jgi:hypothetical protein
MKRLLQSVIAFGLFGTLVAGAADVRDGSPNKSERAEIAQVAVEWLLLDDWKKPQPENAYPRTRNLAYLKRQRHILITSDNDIFPVGILGTNNQIEDSVIYNRVAKKIAPAATPLDRGNSEVIFLEISAAKTGWNVRIGKGAFFFRIEVVREDRLLYVSKFNGAFSTVD